MSKPTKSAALHTAALSVTGDEPAAIGPNSKKAKLAIVDSRSCLRESLADALREHLDKPVIAVDCVDSLTQSPVEFKQNIRTIILGTASPDSDRIESQIQSMRSSFHGARIVLLTDYYEDITYEVFKKYKLNGVIPSAYRTEQLVLCLRTIESGIDFLPPETLEHSVRLHDTDGTMTGPALPNLDALLTPRQQEVLRHIAEGRSNKYIAAELTLCESTVKVHVSEVMRRLGATSRTHASYLIGKFNTGELKPPVG